MMKKKNQLDPIEEFEKIRQLLLPYAQRKNLYTAEDILKFLSE